MRKHAALAFLALAGCATVYDFDQRAPDGRYVSAKSVAQLEQCIVSGLSGLGRLTIDHGETSTYITLRRENGYAIGRVTLRPTSTGSTIAVRQAISYSLGPPIQRCL